MSAKLNHFIQLLKERFGLFTSISLAVFLFVLFFQPFPIDNFDFNNKLIFVAGLAIIVFIVMVLVRVAFPSMVQNYAQNKIDTIFPYYTGGFIILVLSTVAFTFYLQYVGSVSISFYIMFKIILICLIPPVSLWLYDAFRELKRQNESLTEEIKRTRQQIVKYEEDYQNVTVDFISEKSSENITLLISDVVIIRSADNYIEIIFKEEDNYKKKLQRNTLRNIEQQLKPYANFIRCHRTCIVNAYYIEELSRKFNNHWLIIKGYDEQIPVSRQYLLRLKEVL